MSVSLSQSLFWRAHAKKKLMASVLKYASIVIDTTLNMS